MMGGFPLRVEWWQGGSRGERTRPCLAGCLVKKNREKIKDLTWQDGQVEDEKRNHNEEETPGKYLTNKSSHNLK